MRYAILGAGAVGGVIAGLMHRAGAPVVAIARGAHGEAMRRNGLTLKLPEATLSLAVPTVTSLAEAALAADDVVIMAVKSQDTAAALDALLDAAPDVALVCAQNGVNNEHEAARRLARVYAAMVWTPSVHLQPGVVASYAQPAALVRVGRYPRGVDAVTAALADALTAAGLDAAEDTAPMRLKRAKLLTNLGNAIDAAVVAGDDADALARDVRAEGQAVLAAAGAEFMPVGELLALARARLRHAELDGARRPGGSTWQSLARGASIAEIDAFNGEIAALALEHGASAPLNRALLRLARAATTPRSIPARAVRELAAIL